MNRSSHVEAAQGFDSLPEVQIYKYATPLTAKKVDMSINSKS